MKHGDFTALAEKYASYRPGYAPLIAEVFVRLSGQAQPRCVDAGAGTGINAARARGYVAGTLDGLLRNRRFNMPQGELVDYAFAIDNNHAREDYERFLREYKSPSGHCRVLDPAKEKHYYYTFAKVVDTRTLLTETEAEGYRIGIYVDVFPVDYVTDDAAARRRLFKRKRLLYKIRRCKISKHNYLKSPVAFWCYKLLPVSAGMIERLLRRMLIRREPTSTVANVTEAGPSVKSCMPAKDIEDSVDIMFEGKMYKTMIGYEDYLRRTYGDYMTLPPVEQRVTHSFEAYWLE